jgi:hypothetical protein
LLDADLAELYGVPTKVLNQAVKRNRDRFPEDFMFRLSRKESVVACSDGFEHICFTSLVSVIVFASRSNTRWHPIADRRFWCANVSNQSAVRNPQLA